MQDDNKFNYSLCSWMSDLRKVIGNKQINNILIPATHDSCAYRILYDVLLPQNNKLYSLSNTFMCLPCVRDFIRKWTVTQDMNITNQLENGVRCFDIRISYYHDTFYTSHTYACDDFTFVIDDILGFLILNPDELIFLQISFDFEHRNNITLDVEYLLLDLIVDKLGTIIYKNSDIYPTYYDVLSTKERVVIYYSGKVQSDYYHSYDIIHSKWFNESDYIIQLHNLTKLIKKFNHSDFNQLPFTLTPDKNMVIESIFDGNNLRKLNSAMLNSFEMFLDDNRDYFNNVSFISFDYANDNLIKTVIDYNIK